MNSDSDDHRSDRVSPFGNPRVSASLSANRGLSQTTTSFIAFYRLGIHRMHLFTWPYNLKQTDQLFCPITLLQAFAQSVITKEVTSFFAQVALRTRKKILAQYSINFSIPFVKLEKHLKTSVVN